MTNGDTFFLNHLLQELSKISGRPYIWIAPTSEGKYSVHCLTADVPNVDNELEPIFRGLLLGHTLACITDENRMPKFYRALVEFGARTVPMFTTLQLDGEDMNIYMFIPIPDDVREKEYTDWMEYASHHLRQRIRDEQDNPTGLYVDWATACHDYVRLLSDILMNPENAIQEMSSRIVD